MASKRLQVNCKGLNPCNLFPKVDDTKKLPGFKRDMNSDLLVENPAHDPPLSASCRCAKGRDNSSVSGEVGMRTGRDLVTTVLPFMSVTLPPFQELQTAEIKAVIAFSHNAGTGRLMDHRLRLSFSCL